MVNEGPEDEGFPSFSMVILNVVGAMDLSTLRVSISSGTSPHLS